MRYFDDIALIIVFHTHAQISNVCNNIISTVRQNIGGDGDCISNGRSHFELCAAIIL